MKSSHKYRVRRFGFLSKILCFFVDSPLTPLFVAMSILLGTVAVLLLPREEEPQIVVPVVDVFVEMPGTTAKEVEQRVTRPLEKLARELPGVEYVYSTSSPGSSLTIVRFLVGWDEEQAIVELYQKLYANLDRIPAGASRPLLKPRRIDDVPVLALTFHGGGLDFFELRRIAATVDDSVKQVADVSETTLIGGQRRQVRVELDASRLTAYQVDANHVLATLRAANRQSQTGSFPSGEHETLVESGGFLRDAQQVAAVIVGVHRGQLVYLRDVAEVRDGPEEPENYVLYGNGAATVEYTPFQNEEPAVTLSVAKRKGTNAIEVVQEVLRKIELLRGDLIPENVEVTVTRDYGRTATEKSDELLFHMGLAAAGVAVLVALVLGWREAGVVAIAIPVTLALTLATFYWLGFTLNRVTLFALIFSIGILVDDPIVDVENVVRHFRLPENRDRPLKEVTVEAVNEVRSPLILATLTVIAAVLPMAFVQGLMGPYMRPIPVGATAAMLFSMIVAFVVTPWAAYRLLRNQSPDRRVVEKDNWTTRLYRRFMGPLIQHPLLGGGFLIFITLLLFATIAMVLDGSVKVKMLPYDNKSEMQIIVDMDEGTNLEYTTMVARKIASALRDQNEVLNYQIYAGIAAPYNFNGLVRHYFLRRGPNIADIQLNLVHKDERDQQSHDIAKRIRNLITPIAEQYRARVKVAEVPPGPPVLQTIVAEVYGPDYQEQIAIARHIRELFEQTAGVVDVDWFVEADQPKVIYQFDQEKAALNRIGAEQVEQLIYTAQVGANAGLLHAPEAKEDVPIRVRLPIAQRSIPTELLPIPLCADVTCLPVGDLSRIVSNAESMCVPLGEVTRIIRSTSERNIYHKNLLPVVYVTGDVAGAEESPIYALLQLNEKIHSYIPEGRDVALDIWNTRQPFSTQQPSMKWDGEWHITYEVFRDLGFAFAVVLVLIYALVVGWFRSFRTPVVIMCAIPFSLVGIIPAHWALGAFFTATSMIGFMAGAGIVVRNSIILVDFIKLRVKQGMPLSEAVVDAGAVRFRPMMLTAMAVVVGGSVILFDPIFQGLAVSLIAGEFASLFISRMAVPIIYFFSMRTAGMG